MNEKDPRDREIEPTHGGGRRDAEKKGSDDAELKKHLNVRQLPKDHKEDVRRKQESGGKG